MRITRDALLKIAKDNAAFKAVQDKTLMCIYLTGSLATDLPLLGGAADIDLIFVHDRQPARERELVRITDEVHLDIAHYVHLIYDQPRKLRLNPWIGSYLIADPRLLYETQHWFEFTQASAAAHFYQPDNILARVRPLVDAARRTWMEMSSSTKDGSLEGLLAYLKALENVGNAVACLSGPPLPERRFFLLFPNRAEKIGHPELTSGLINLFMKSPPTEELWQGWLIDWENAYLTVSGQPNCPVKLHAYRKAYYQRAIDALSLDNAPAALWILLRTWALAASNFRVNAAAHHPFKVFRQTIGVDDAALPARLKELDAFLDKVEDVIDGFARQNGLS
jgi:hypothetical protein